MSVPSTLLALLFLGSATVEAQGLGAAAQKEKEKRESKVKETTPAARPPETKVYTGADLDGYAATRPPEETESPKSTASRRQAGDSQSGSASRSSSAATRRSSGGRSPMGGIPDDSDARASAEKDWRARAEAARTAVVAAEKELREAESISSGTYNPKMYESYVDREGRIKTRDAEKINREMQERTTRARASLEKARQSVEQLEESARRQGVPPGWLR